MAEDVQAQLRDAADRASDAVHEVADHAGETIRKAADKVNDAAKGGIKTARHLAGAAQQFVQESGIADVDLRKVVEREPWLALGVAFAIGYVAAQVVRRLS
jgi:ElaB/YqjD/DUF883 family membrane-anchored ribosome-binding protein